MSELVEKLVVQGKIFYIYYVLAFLFFVMFVISLKNYKKDRDRIKSFVDRCASCKAVVIHPVVMEFSNKQLAKDGVNVIASMAGIPNVKETSNKTVRTKVKYMVDGKTIETEIQRCSGIRHPKVGSEIDIFYDPQLPQHAFGEDMRKFLLKGPLNQCIEMSAFSLLLFVLGLLFQIS